MCASNMSAATVHDVCRLILHHEINVIWKGQASVMDFSVLHLAWPSIPIGNLGKTTKWVEQATLLRAAAAEVTSSKGFDLFALYSAV